MSARMMAAESSKKIPPYSFIQDEQSPAESGRLRPGQCRRLRRLRRMSARRMSARRMPAKMMNQPKSKVKIQGFCFFPQPPRGGYFSPRDENHNKGDIFPPETRTGGFRIFPYRQEGDTSPQKERTKTRGLFFPPTQRGGYFSPNRRGVSELCGGRIRKTPR